MSLKPVKKSDQEKDWLKKRNDKKNKYISGVSFNCYRGNKNRAKLF